MSNQQTNDNFWTLWVLANTASFCLCFVMISLLITPVIPGVAQWLILKKQITRLSRWWILTNFVGIFVMGIVFYYLLFSNLSPFCIKYVDTSVCWIVSCTICSAIGGAITGTYQWLLLRRHILLPSLWIVWTITSTFTWAVSAALSSTISWNMLVIANNLVGALASFGVFGTVFGAVNGFLTGIVLVWLLQRSIY